MSARGFQASRPGERSVFPRFRLGHHLLLDVVAASLDDVVKDGIGSDGRGKGSHRLPRCSGELFEQCASLAHVYEAAISVCDLLLDLQAPRVVERRSCR